MESLLTPANISDAIDLYNALLETNSSGIFVYDPDGNLIDCNQVACDMHELNKREILKMKPAEFIHPDGYATFEAFQKDLQKSGSFFGESCGITKSGKKFYVEVYGRSVNVKGKTYLYSSVKDITKQKQYIEKLKAQEKNLESQVMERTFQLEEAMRKLKSAQKRLIGAERLATLGSLLGGIAHELKNPLNLTSNASLYIKGFLEDLSSSGAVDCLTEKLKEELPSAIEMARISYDSSMRADQVIQGMLGQVRSERPTLQEVDVAHLLREALSLALSASSQGDKLEVSQTLPEGLKAFFFPQELTRAVINLVDNSVYSMKQKFGNELTGAKLKFETACRGERLFIEITDNGEGMSEDVISKITEQFFTTKPHGKGTGIGLALTREIIEDLHQGTLNFDSEEGAFTKVTIGLPLNLDK